MQRPDWWERPSLRSRLLLPASALWRAGTAMRRIGKHPVPHEVPVICIGNATAGGAGKTPLVMACVDILTAASYHPHIVSRGYGGSLEGPERVDPARHGFRDTGDEPLLLARHAPCWVARDRRRGITAADAEGAQFILLDDGLQNPSLLPDLSILVIDGEYGIGNGRVMPAGPLREPLHKALERVQAVVIIGRDRQGIATRLPEGIPIFFARLDIKREALPEKAVAFAGIGRPAKFFDSLQQQGVELKDMVSFPDHHPFGDSDIALLRQLAEIHQAPLLTTEKDTVRLPPAFRPEVQTVPVTLVFDPPDFALWLLERCKEIGA